MRLVILLCVSFFYAQTGLADTEVERKMRVEQSISQNMTQELSTILPSHSYAVFTSVDLVMTKVRELVEGESLVASSAKAKSPKTTYLGFESPEEDDEEATNGGTEKQVYRMTDKEEIRHVNIRIVVDESVSENLLTTARAVMADRVQTSFGSKGKISFQRGSLPAPRSAAGELAMKEQPSIWQNLRGMWLWIALGLVACGLLALLIKNLLRRSAPELATGNYSNANDERLIETSMDRLPLERMRMMQLMPYAAPMSNMQQTAEPMSEAAPIQTPALPPAEGIERALEQFVDEVSSDPLIARSYFQSLDEKSKTTLVGCFQTSAFKDALEKMMGIQFVEASAPMLADVVQKREFLRSISRELNQFNRLMAVQLSQRFGLLSLLNQEELFRLMQRLPEASQTVVLKHLPRAVAAQVIRKIPDHKLAVLMQRLSREEPYSVEELQDTEDLLQESLKEIRREIMMPSANTTSLLDLIVEEARDPSHLLGVLALERPDLAQRYERYVMTFEDFVRADKDTVGRTLDKVSNEDIAQTLFGLDDGVRQAFLGHLSPSRRGVIGALTLSLKSKRSEDSAEQARKNLLKIYREQSQAPSGVMLS